MTQFSIRDHSLSITSGSGTFWEIRDIHWGKDERGAILGTQFYLNQAGPHFLKYKDTTQVCQLFRSKKYPEVFSIIQSTDKAFFEYTREEDEKVFPLNEWDLIYDFIRPDLIADTQIAELEAEIVHLKAQIEDTRNE